MDFEGPDTSKGAHFYEKGMKYEPPPHGRGSRSVMRYKFDFVDWARDPVNIAAWDELTSLHSLKESSWRKDVGSVFGRASFALHRPYPSILRYVIRLSTWLLLETYICCSSSKAKRYGFLGFVDSTESIFSVLEEFVQMKSIPRPHDIIPKSC